jgi:hypothetical protein
MGNISLIPHPARASGVRATVLTGAGAPDFYETESEAIEHLARRLHFLMEKFDPTGDDVWENLTDRQRTIFIACVSGMLAEPSIELHLKPTIA